jgi:hypothetical protein
MINKRFSAEMFESLGLDTYESLELSKELEKEIALEMDSVLTAHFATIIEKLNDMGHNLRVESSEIGEAVYRDDSEDSEGYTCKLRVAYDGVVSVGYSHLISNNQ